MVVAVDCACAMVVQLRFLLAADSAVSCYLGKDVAAVFFALSGKHCSDSDSESETLNHQEPDTQ